MLQELGVRHQLVGTTTAALAWWWHTDGCLQVLIESWNGTNWIGAQTFNHLQEDRIRGQLEQATAGLAIGGATPPSTTW